jgi:hypothetical protein
VKPADVLHKKGLEDVADDLDWVYDDGDVPEDEDDIKETVINMLSIFEPQEALPEEFRCPESPLTSERSKKYQELAKLFTEYATKDPGLFLQMRDIIDPNFQSRVFFEKIENRVTQTFNALDEYIKHGPTDDASVDALRFDLPTTAKKLVRLVKAIGSFVEQQDEDDPDFKSIASRSAAALVRILDLVTDRNVDAYENITWGIRPGSPSENNLYYALIGNPVTSTSFVLNALQLLPHEDVIRNHWATLQDIEDKLVQHNVPVDYLNTFRQVVHDNRKRAASEARGGQVKRPAS